MEVGRRGTLAVPEVDMVGDRDERRRRAVSEATTEALTRLEPSESGSWRPAIAARRYGPGCLVLALAGSFDRAGIEALRAMRPDLQRLARTELVLELAHLSECPPPLARMLAHVRVAALTAGARVELHRPPDALRAELGHTPVEAYTMREDPAPSSSTARHHDEAPHD